MASPNLWRYLMHGALVTTVLAIVHKLNQPLWVMIIIQATGCWEVSWSVFISNIAFLSLLPTLVDNLCIDWIFFKFSISCVSLCRNVRRCKDEIQVLFYFFLHLLAIKVLCYLSSWTGGHIWTHHLYKSSEWEENKNLYFANFALAVFICRCTSIWSCWHFTAPRLVWM